MWAQLLEMFIKYKGFIVVNLLPLFTWDHISKHRDLPYITNMFSTLALESSAALYDIKLIALDPGYFPNFSVCG